MMLEYVLEKYPASLKLRDGTSVLVRPLGKRDEKRLHKFLLSVPEEERLFINCLLYTSMPKWGLPAAGNAKKGVFAENH